MPKHLLYNVELDGECENLHLKRCTFSCSTAGRNKQIGVFTAIRYAYKTPFKCSQGTSSSVFVVFPIPVVRHKGKQRLRNVDLSILSTSLYRYGYPPF